MLPNKLSNRGVIKSAAFLLYGENGTCVLGLGFVVGFFFFFLFFFHLKGDGERKVKWAGALLKEKRLGLRACSTSWPLMLSI